MDQPLVSAPPRADDVISNERFERYHRFARERGTSRVLYYFIRLLFTPVFLIYFRLQRTGREHARVERRDDRRRQPPQLPRPVRDRRAAALAAADAVRRQGRAVREALAGMVPLAPRRLPDPPRSVRRDRDGDRAADRRARRRRSASSPRAPASARGSLGRPKRGVGRLALETGAAVLPVAVQGTEHVRRGWRIRPRKVKLRAGTPMHFPRTERPSPALAASVTDRIWPNIELQWEWLGGLPPLRKAAVIGAGSWGTAVAVLLARGGLEVELGTRTDEKADEITRRGENEKYLPGVKLPEGLSVKRSGGDRARRAATSSASPSPPRRCPTWSARSPTGSARAPAVLLLSKGLVAADGGAAARVRLRARARPAIACLGGPAHAKEATDGMAALVLGSSRPRPADDARRGLRPRRASSASAPTTSSASRSPAPPRTPPPSPPLPPSRTASTPPGSPPPRSGASASTSRSRRGAGSRPSPAWPGSAT